MFVLRFWPSFSRQRIALLREKTLPPIAVPEIVENCIATLERTDFDTRGLSVGKLWSSSLRVTRPLLLRTAGAALLASVSAACATLAGMEILKSGTDLRRGLLFAGAYFGMNILSQAGRLHSERLRSWVGLGGEAHLAGLVAQKLVRLSPRAASAHSAGNLKVLITSDVKNVGTFLDNAVRNLVPTFAAMIVITPLIIQFTGWAGIIGIIAMFSLLPMSLGLNRISSHFQNRSQSELDRLTSLVGEWVSNIRLVRYLSWESRFESDISKQLRAYMRPSVWQHFMACLIFGLSSSWWMVAAAAVLVSSAFITPALDLTGFFGSLWLLTFLAGYLTHLPNTIRLYGIAVPSMNRIANFMRAEERRALLFPSSLRAPMGKVRRVRFENVTYTYPDGTTALRDLNVEFDLSEKIAVLGEVGSGKSTLLKLVCGEFPPTEGRVWVEDEAGGRASLWETETYDHLRNTLAFVPQEPFVAHDLFRRNISLSDEEIESRIVEAAYFAELEADLASFPKGLDQEIGESGVNLSGGQRQRLNLARAIYSERPNLVLDDTLSAVDGKTEARLVRRLTEREGGVILVTHRTRELRSVDRVIVLKDGAVVEAGTYSGLIARADSHLNRILRAYGERR